MSTSTPILDVDADVDADLDGHVHGPSLLSLLGVGRAPFAVVLLCFLGVFGSIGFIVTLALGGSTDPSTSTALVAGATALVIALLTTRALASLIGRAIPPVETYATEPADLIGVTGRVEIDATPQFGVVRVADESGAFHHLRCRTYGARIARGATVLVTEHDLESGFFTVAENPLSAEI